MARTNRKVAAFVSILLVGLAAAACDSTHASGDGPTLDTTGLTWGDGGSVDAATVSLDTARVARPARDYTVTNEAPAGVQGRDYLVTHALLDDVLIVAKSPGDAYNGGEWLAASDRLGLLRDGKFEPVGESPTVKGDHPRQVVGAAANGDSVAWFETESTNLYDSNWRLFSWTRGGKVRLVARSEEVIRGIMPQLDQTTAPVLANGRVYWPSPSAPGRLPADSSDDVEMAVFSKALDGSGGLRRDLADATDPIVDGDRVFALSVKNDGSYGQKLVEIRDDGGPAPVIQGADKDAFWQALSADKGRLAFVAVPDLSEDDEVTPPSPTSTATKAPAKRATLYVADPASRTATQIPLDSDGLATEAKLCGARVVWSSANAAGTGSTAPVYVYDVAEKALWRIDRKNAYQGVFCSGDTIGWMTLEPTPGALASTTIVRWHPANG